MTPWGSTIVIEVSSAEPDAEPDWVDITQWIIIPNGTDISTMLGRQTELSSPEPGRGNMLLRNDDERFTPGNSSSPYYPWWKQSRRIRIREIYGYLGFDLADGYLEIPETVIKAQTVSGSIRLITMTVSWIDVLGRLQNAATFISNLAAHIRHHGGNTLAGYWPMTERSTPFYPVTGQNLPLRQEFYHLNWGDPSSWVGKPRVTPASADPPPGEDVQLPLYEMEVHQVGSLLRPARSVMTQTTIPTGTFTVQPGEVMTLVMWVKSPWTAVDSEADPAAFRFLLGISEGFMSLVKQDGANSTWLMDLSGSSGFSVSFDGPIAATDRWTLIGMRWGFDPTVAELWVDDTQTVGVVTGSNPATSMEITQLYAPLFRFDGSIAHVQLYIGAEDDWTFDDFTAQRRLGLQGWDRQLTGDRINTVLDYAGFPASRRDIDPGVAVMQPISLAGQRPLQALEEATDTEQGRLFAQGGRIKFHDRRRVRDV